VARTVTFYHSVVCPPCRLTSLFLRSLLADYPGVRSERVELLTNQKAAHDAGVRSISAFVSGGQRLSGLLISRSRLRRFLDVVAVGAD
jgi:hypothetical protein